MKDAEFHTKKILELVRTTVGRAESSDRAEFDKGVQVAVDKAIQHFIPIFENLRGNMFRETVDASEMRKELTTIASIIKKYSEEE